MIKVSIAIPVFNEIRFIEDTLRSVINEGDEIVISDNASTDGTSEIIARFCKKYKHIKHIRHKKNMGSLRNFQFAIEQCQGEYIRLLGAHDLISKDSTKSMLRIFEKYPDAISVYSSKCVAIDENNMPMPIFAKNIDLTISSSIHRVLNFLLNATEFINYSIFYSLYKRDYIQSINKWSILKNGSNDIEFLCRMAYLGKLYSDETSQIYIRGINLGTTIERKSERYKNSLGLSFSAWAFVTILGLYNALSYLREASKQQENIMNRILDLLFALYNINNIDTFELKQEIEQKKFIKDDYLDLAKYVFEKICEYKKESVVFNKLHSFLCAYKAVLPNANRINKYIIFGSGKNGQHLMADFSLNNIAIDYFCDNNPIMHGKIILGVKCISFDDIKQYKDSAIIFVSPKNANSIYGQLNENNFKYIFPREFMETLIL